MAHRPEIPEPGGAGGLSAGDPSTLMTLRRRHAIAHRVRGLAAGLLVYHRIEVQGAEHLPRQGPALILPKHRAYRDILVEGVVLYRVAGRYANYVMKVGLWGLLELLGGVKIVRPKDVRRLQDREARKAEIRLARQANQRTVEYLSWLYSQGELIVSHPEGMRYQDTMGPMQKEIVEHLLQVERQRDMRIPIIPVGLEYESYVRPRARIWVRVGAPLDSGQFADSRQLVAAIDQRLRALSGFPP
jgi:1-acyl-sn-glycerol-3-phosphate acyltransferase